MDAIFVHNFCSFFTCGCTTFYAQKRNKKPFFSSLFFFCVLCVCVIVIVVGGSGSGSGSGAVGVVVLMFAFFRQRSDFFSLFASNDTHFLTLFCGMRKCYCIGTGAAVDDGERR